MKTRIKWIEGASFVGESGSGHAVVIDGAPEHGGRNLGMRPMETFLTGAAACTAFDVVSILKKGRHAVTDVVVTVEGERALEAPRVFTALHYVYTVAGLARMTQVGFASMSRMLDRLEEKDLLRRERSETDRRVVHLHLTAKGKKVANKIWPIVVDGMHVHLDGFKKEELTQLNGLLGRMLANGARDDAQ